VKVPSVLGDAFYTTPSEEREKYVVRTKDSEKDIERKCRYNKVYASTVSKMLSYFGFGEDEGDDVKRVSMFCDAVEEVLREYV
jgi:hypothetical protein